MRLYCIPYIYAVHQEILQIFQKVDFAKKKKNLHKLYRLHRYLTDTFQIRTMKTQGTK